MILFDIQNYLQIMARIDSNEALDILVALVSVDIIYSHALVAYLKANVDSISRDYVAEKLESKNLLECNQIVH